jgi:2',3'-cyclic-nucleotide 2'-phosphodiesterase / 3'-nucleotidase / 5'-nucleotidase
MPLTIRLLQLLSAAVVQTPTAEQAGAPARTPDDSAHVVVVATTDIHGHATDWDYVANGPFPGGLTRVATVVDSLRAAYPGQVVVVDAGDLIQGDAFATYFARVAPRDPNPVMEAMNLAGYDVATPGNHEFDWGLASMRRTISGAAFPYVSGNLYTLPADTLLYPPFVTLQRNGVRIGVTGFTTPGAAVWNSDHLRGNIRVERIPVAARRIMERLRRESDLTVVLAHSGMGGRASYDTTGVGDEHAAATLATLTDPPDLVVVGHSHREIRDTVVGRVHFVQPKPYGASVSITHVDLVRRDGRWRPVRIRGELQSTALVPPSPRVGQRLAPARASVLEWAGTAVGEAAGPMRAAASRMEPTAIMNFVHSVQLKRTGAQLSAVSAFDLKAGFDSGGIRMRDLVALYPFDNTLRVIRVTGAQLKEYLEHSVRYFKVDPAGRISIDPAVPGYDYDMVGGARYDIDLTRRVGDRIRNLSVRGRAVSPGDRFTLAVNSHRQTGAGGFGMLRGAPVLYDRHENIRDLLVEEIRLRKTIDPSIYASRDWRIVPEMAAASVRSLFRVPQRPAPTGPRDSVLLRIVATADLHGALVAGLAGGEPSGAAVLSSTMDSLAAECGCPIVRLDAGGAMHGTVASNITHGRAMVDVLNGLGIAATALSEGDLTWSVDTLRRRISEARFHWLAGNVFDSATGRRPDWAVPYRILEGGGLKVAVVGYITADAKGSLKAELTRGLRFDDGALAIRDVLAEVRALRPDITILLAHAGAECQGPVCTGEVVRLADAVEPRTLDLIVAGHTHQTVDTRIAGISIIEPDGERTVAVADVVRTSAGGREVRARVQTISPDRVDADEQMTLLVDGYRRRTDVITSRVVASVKFPLPREGDQHRLGGLIAEARRNVLRADVGLVANTEIGADLPAGPVTYGQLYRVQPSENGLVKVTLTGAQLREVLEHALSRNGRPEAHIAGARVRYDPRRPAGRRIQRLELLGSRKFEAKAEYTLATDDFLASGGEGYRALVNRPSVPASMLDVDALIAYLKRLPQPAEFTALPAFRSTR